MNDPVNADDAALEFQRGEAARIYPWLLVVLTVGMLLYVPLVILSGGPPAQIAAPYATLAGCALSWLVHKRGHTRAAMLVIVWVLWAGMMLQGALRGGLANPSFSTLAVLMLIGGWLLGLRQGIYVGIASVLGTLALSWAIELGLLHPAPVEQGMRYWFAQATVTVLAMILMAMLLRAYWRHLARARTLTRRDDIQRRLLSERERELMASENRFLRMHESSPVPITLSRIDDGRYIDVNPAWEKLFGWSRDQVRGKSSLDIDFFLDKADRARGVALFRRDGRAQFELVAKTITGERRTLVCSVESIDYEGEPAALTMLFDITERQRAEDQLRRLNDELEARVAERTAELQAAVRELGQTLAHLQRTQDDLVQAEKHASLGRLVAGVAHELNTPIGNALTACTTLAGEFSGFAGQVADGKLKRSQLDKLLNFGREGLSIIERALRRAASLVQSFKQVAVDQASEQRRQFSLRQLVEEVVATLRPSYREMPWEIEIDVPPTLAMDSYPGAIEQILMSLIGNALTHAFDGRENRRIVLSAEGADCGAQIVLRCRDNGRGIAPEHLGRIFDPFFTTRLGSGSSGLGLAIVQQQATHLLGGQIVAESTLGVGTCFTLRVPASAPAVHQTAAAANSGDTVA